MPTSVDKSHDYVGQFRKSLNALFAPQNVAVVGATEKTGSVGSAVFANLLATYHHGKVFPINPKRETLLGQKAYPSLKHLPEKVDLAIVIVPATAVAQVIAECAEVGIKGVVIISAGFREVGESGVRLEKEILHIAQQHGIRIIGPNCLGIMRPSIGLNATFAHAASLPGKIAFLSQSGALCTSILDWSLRERIGFSAFVSTGTMLDVGWGDLIDYFGDDPETQSIVLYMESIGDARAFLSVAREVARTKPIIVIKAGRTEAAAKAAVSHTGAMVGSDEVLDAAFRRSGILRVNSIAELFMLSEILAKQPRPKGPRLTILTNAGGPGVLATDALIANGGELATLSPETLEKLNAILPATWSHNNPVDTIGDASPELYAATAKILLEEKKSDGLLAILSPQAMTHPTKTAELFVEATKGSSIPLFSSWMGGSLVAGGEEVLNIAGIPTFSYPDTAARVFSLMWQHSSNIEALYQTPEFVDDSDSDGERRKIGEVLERVRQSGRTILDEVESKQILAAYGIPVVPTQVAHSAEEAVQLAQSLNFPVVLKLFSRTVTHKTDVGGVKLNLRNEAEVLQAFTDIQRTTTEIKGAQAFEGVSVQPMISRNDGYELILGMSPDAQFGPVLLFGAGGQLVEVYKDSALGLPPLNTTLSRRLMEQTRIFHALKGVRGRKPVDLQRLDAILVRFSQLIVEQPFIKEIDINPLFASAEQIFALDARIVLHEQHVQQNDLPKLAIHPYPTQYVCNWQSKDGESLMLRPIRPEDEPMMVKFHQALSQQTVYQRYFYSFPYAERITHDRLSRLCFIDYEREMALVAEHYDIKNHERSIIGAARLSRIHGTHEAEFSLVIADAFQKKTLGAALLSQLISIAQEQKLRRITAVIRNDNVAMQNLCRRLGFELRQDSEKTVASMLF